MNKRLNDIMKYRNKIENKFYGSFLGANMSEFKKN